MKIMTIPLVGSLLLNSWLAVAQPHDHSQQMMAQPTPTETDKTPSTYQAAGIVKGWQGDKIVIAHEAIAALNWPPMTMAFIKPTNVANESIATGTAVSFSFIQTGKGYQLIELNTQSH